MQADRGAAVFPNVLLDVTGTSASLTTLFPVAPDLTIVVDPELTVQRGHTIAEATHVALLAEVAARVGTASTHGSGSEVDRCRPHGNVATAGIAAPR